MINLARSLQSDISEGIETATTAGDLLAIETTIEPVITHNDQDGRGDYASPVAMVLAKLTKKPPMEIVEIIAKHMPKKEYVGKLEAAAPGFLNIWINNDWLATRLDDISEEDINSGDQIGQGKSVNLEFISANPTGPLTLGNARTAFSVDTLGNVLSAVGYNVTREYYINDGGNQVKKLGESVLRRVLIEQGEKVDFSEELYQGEYIKTIGQQIAENWQENQGKKLTAADLENKEVMEQISEQAMQQCLAIIKKIINEDLKIKFDVWTSEQALRKSGIIEKALTVLREKKLTYMKDGAEYLLTTKFGDDQDRVIVKKDGEYAYIAPDIGYHLDKYERKFDMIFTFLGADHQGHVPKLKAAMEALGQDTKRMNFIVGQWIALLSGGKPVKLSKRRGEVYSPADLIAEIGYDAARFFLVQHALASHMELDLDLAKERSERNPVYYVQYAYVRLQSILRKAQEQGVIDSTDQRPSLEATPKLTDESEVRLVKQILRLSEIMENISITFEVQALAYYALELAKSVQVFYRNVPVLAADNDFVKKDRLQLVFAARRVLANTLDLLGISKPDVM